MPVKQRGPNPVDVYVGERVRIRRKHLNISQETLAKALDLTFQQIQKYERGSNRISASKLYQISQVLKVPMSYFFQGFEEREGAEGFKESESEQLVHGFLKTAEGLELAQTFPRIKSAKHRRKVLELVQALEESVVER